MTTDDKPAPVVHLGTLATACGLRSIAGFPGTGDIEKVTCPECAAQEERRKYAVALSNVNPRPIDDIVEVTVTLRADLLQAMTPELGPKMARAAVHGPAEYDSVQRPINVRHISMNADDTFTLAYEEGAMDPAKPAPVLYRYSLQSADEAGEKRHPQLVIHEHFPDATEMEGHAIGDCWLFKAVERKAPGYFVVVKP
jgi:hypothetical protein